MIRTSSGLTGKQTYGDRLRRMKPEQFLDQASFKNEEGDPDFFFVTVMNSTFKELLSLGQLSEIIFAFLKKWPISVNHEEVADAASALVYHKHYEFLHQRKMPEQVKKRLVETFENLGLTDKKPSLVAREKRKKKNGSPKDIGDDTAVKLRGMDITQMFAWEKELGIPAEIIEKQKELAQKSMGLARMHIANKIRNVSKKSKPEEQ